MARPTVFTEKDYKTGFKKLIEEDGIDYRKITANTLFKKVGGRYTMASDLVKKFKAEEEKKEVEKDQTPSMADWYVEVKTRLMLEISNQLDDNWPEIAEAESKAKEKLEAAFLQQEEKLNDRIADLEGQSKEDMARLADLEPMEQQLEDMTTAFNKTTQERDQLQIKLDAAVAKVADQEGQLNTMTVQCDKANKAKAELDGQLITLKDELKDSKSKVTDLTKANTQLTKDTKELEPTKTKLAAVLVKLEQHEAKAGEHADNAVAVATLTERLSGKDTRIDELSGLAEDLQSQINDLNQQVGQLSTLKK